jgi:ribosome recycling factor
MDLVEAKKKEFEAAFAHISKELQGLRTGRATSGLVEQIMVQAYGKEMRLQELASITPQDARTLLVEPWDKTLLKDIDRAISSSKLGLSSSVSEATVRVSVPSLTEETRKNLVKVVKEKTQEAIESLRRIRDSVREEVSAALRAKSITEDDRFRLQEKLDKESKAYQQKFEDLQDRKIAEVMKV